MQTLKILVACVLLALVGCRTSGTRNDQAEILEGPELDTVVERVQQSMDKILASDDWTPFELESKHWRDTCRAQKIAAQDTCVDLEDEAFAACSDAGTGPSAEERCRRIFAGDRTICSTATKGTLKKWCDLSKPEALCAIGRKTQAAACDAASAVPSLTLTGAKIVANVAVDNSSGGNISLLVFNFGGSRTVKRATQVEINLLLRPSRDAYKAPDGTTWSPRGELNAQEKISPSPVSADADRIARTVKAALSATAARFELAEGNSTKIVPLRPKTFSFTFDFSIVKSKSGGFEIDLAPTPIKLGAKAGTDATSSNQIVFQFGPEP